VITTAACDSFKTESADAVHQPGDTYKIALYTSAATLDKNTTAYSSTNEVVGSGYTGGGKVLAGRVSALSGDISYLDWDDPTWAVSTITARGCLIYNASRSNKALAVFDFGSDIVSTNGTFTVQLPPPGATAVLRFE
jgi:hypothetical protein